MLANHLNTQAISFRNRSWCLLLTSFGMAIATVAYPAEISSWQADRIGQSIRESVLSLASIKKLDDIGGLLWALGVLKSHETDKVLVEFADYYLGESNSEDANAAVTHRGKSLLPLLQAQMTKPPHCERAIPCLSKEQRDSRLSIWIKQIRQGELVEYIR